MSPRERETLRRALSENREMRATHEAWSRSARRILAIREIGTEFSSSQARLALEVLLNDLAESSFRPTHLRVVTVEPELVEEGA
jgi:hypothetical protein